MFSFFIQAYPLGINNLVFLVNLLHERLYWEKHHLQQEFLNDVKKK